MFVCAEIFEKIIARPRARTWNLLLRRQTRYQLRQPRSTVVPKRRLSAINSYRSAFVAFCRSPFFIVEGHVDAAERSHQCYFPSCFNLGHVVRVVISHSCVVNWGTSLRTHCKMPTTTKLWYDEAIQRSLNWQQIATNSTVYAHHYLITPANLCTSNNCTKWKSKWSPRFDVWTKPIEYILDHRLQVWR